MIRSNGTNLFPALPSLIEDFIKRDWLDNSADWKFSGATLPSVNIQETQEDYRIDVAAPGMKKDDFKIELEDNVLTISAHIEKSGESTNEKNNFSRREFSYESFQRSFALPENKIAGDRITAKYTDGILQVSVPKREEVKVKPPRQITVS